MGYIYPCLSMFYPDLTESSHIPFASYLLLPFVIFVQVFAVRTSNSLSGQRNPVPSIDGGFHSTPKCLVYKGTSHLNGWLLGVPLFQKTSRERKPRFTANTFSLDTSQYFKFMKRQHEDLCIVHQWSVTSVQTGQQKLFRITWSASFVHDMSLQNMFKDCHVVVDGEIVNCGNPSTKPWSIPQARAEQARYASRWPVADEPISGRMWLRGSLSPFEARC